jgi:hypothetical protein
MTPAAMTRTSTSWLSNDQFGTTSSFIEPSGGPCRPLRIAQACMRAGTCLRGGISSMSYRSFTRSDCDPVLPLFVMSVATAVSSARNQNHVSVNAAPHHTTNVLRRGSAKAPNPKHKGISADGSNQGICCYATSCRAIVINSQPNPNHEPDI